LSKLSDEALVDPDAFYNYKNHSTTNKQRQIDVKRKGKEMRVQLMEQLKIKTSDSHLGE
jgi:hypothetical protein